MSTTTSFARKTLHTNQQGMVSIMVTMILMIVMSLIVLGFAQNSRRNQRETLDRQLSTQAFYAAESGVNDAHNLIAGTTAVPPAKTSCSDTGTGGFYQSLIDNATINATNKVSYSCVLVNPAPNTLAYNGVNTTGTSAPLFSGTGAAFNSINFTWTNPGVMTDCPAQYTSGTNIYTPTSGWSGCRYGVVRMDLVPVSGNLTTSSLQSSTRTIWVVPTKTTGVNTYNFTTDGNKVIGVKCSDGASGNCTLTINGLSGSQYYLRMQSIYQPSSMTITSSLGLAGAQVMVDSTGKAQDVLRRIQVRFPLSNNGSKNQLPDNALQSTDSICKRFSVMDGYFSNSVDVDGNNNLCQ